MSPHKKENMMSKKLFLMSLLLGLTACQDSSVTSLPPENTPQTVDEKVIYGSDGRRDLYQARSLAQKKLADSTVALIKKSSLIAGVDSSQVVSQTFGESYGLCPGSFG